MENRVPEDVKQARIGYLTSVLNKAFDDNKAALGRRLGFKDGSLIGQWLRGQRAIHEQALASLADLPEVRAVRLSVPSAALQVAHALSLDRAETVPSTTWGQLKMLQSTTDGVFRLPIETVEMEPRVKRGTWVQFAGHLRKDAQPGDGVIVRDGAGGIHFRVYRVGAPGTWEAHAENENFKPLLSDRDGLQVVAVLTAVEGRWS